MRLQQATAKFQKKISQHGFFFVGMRFLKGETCMDVPWFTTHPNFRHQIGRSVMNMVDIHNPDSPTCLCWKADVAWYRYPVFVLWKYTIPCTEKKKKTPLIFQASCRRTWIPATSGREFDSEGARQCHPNIQVRMAVKKKPTNESLRFMSWNGVVARIFFNQDQTQWSGKSKLRKNMFPFRQSWKNCWIIPAPSKGCQLNLN